MLNIVFINITDHVKIIKGSHRPARQARSPVALLRPAPVVDSNLAGRADYRSGLALPLASRPACLWASISGNRLRRFAHFHAPAPVSWTGLRWLVPAPSATRPGLGSVLWQGRVLTVLGHPCGGKAGRCPAGDAGAAARNCLVVVTIANTDLSKQ